MTDINEIAKRCVDSPGWVWEPGLPTLCGLLWLGDGEDGNTYVDGGMVTPDGEFRRPSGECDDDTYTEILPDVTSPIVLGWVLGLVHRNMPDVSVVRVPGGWQACGRWPEPAFGMVCNLAIECLIPLMARARR